MPHNRFRNPRQHRFRRSCVESLEKRHLLAGDIAVGGDQPADVAASQVNDGLNQRTISTLAAGEAISAVATRLDLGFAAGANGEDQFSYDYDAALDELVIHAFGDIHTFRIDVPITGTSSAGFTMRRAVSLKTNANDFQSAAGIASTTALDEVRVQADAAGTYKVRIANFFSGSLITKLQNEFATFHPNATFVGLDAGGDFRVLRVDPDRGGNFVFSGSDDLDTFRFTENPLGDLTDATLDADVPQVVRTNGDFQIPFTVRPGSTNTRGAVTSVTASLFDRRGERLTTQTVNLSAGQDSGVFQFIAPREENVGALGVDVRIVVNFAGGQTDSRSTFIRVFPADAPKGAFAGANGLFALDEFDIVAIDDLVRPSDSVPNGPEIRYGVLQGRVSPVAATTPLTSQRFETAERIRVSVPLDTTQGVRTTSFDFDVTLGGFFSIHVEDLLKQANVVDPRLFQLNPRLTADFLKLELITDAGNVIDTLEFNRDQLLALLSTGLIPSPREFPRPLEVDLKIENDRAFGTDSRDPNRIFTDVLIHNSALIDKSVAEDVVLRIEIDFGDDTEPVGINLNPAAFRAAARLQQEPEFFGDRVSLVSLLTANQAEPFRRHTYADPGEYEITVTATMGQQIDTETKSVSILARPPLSVENVRLQSDFVTQTQYRTRITGTLVDLDLDESGFPNPTLRVQIGDEEVEASIESLTEDDDNPTSFTFEALVESNVINLLNVETDDQAFVRGDVLLTFLDTDGDVALQRQRLQVQVAEVFNAGIANRGQLYVNVDAGFRGANPYLAEVTNLPITFTRLDDNFERQEFTEFVNVVAELDRRSQALNLAGLALKKHFGGADSVPNDVELVGIAIDDREIGIAVFLEAEGSDELPPEQRKGELVDAKTFVNRSLHQPFINFGSEPNFPTGLLRLRDSGGINLGAISRTLFDQIEGFNGLSSITLSSEDNAFGFPLETQDVRTIFNPVPGGGQEIAGRRSGPATLILSNQEVGFELRIDTVIGESGPNIGGNSQLDPDDFEPLPESEPADRTVQLGILRGESSAPGITAKRNELLASNTLVIGASHGGGQTPTDAVHRITIDWGDGSPVEQIELSPVGPDGAGIENAFAELSHTYTPEFIESMVETPAEFENRLRASGLITITAVEVQDGFTRGTPVQRTVQFFGHRIVEVNVDETAELRPEIDNFVQQQPDAGDQRQQTTQIRKAIVGRGLDGFEIDTATSNINSMFDYTIDLGDGRVFRVQRDLADIQASASPFVSSFARLFRNASATGDPESIRMEGGAIQFIDSRTFQPVIQYDEVGEYTITVTQPAGLIIQGRSTPTTRQGARLDIVVMPDVGIGINPGDGSLAGSISSPVNSQRANGETKLILTAIDSNQENPQPLEVDLATTEGTEFFRAFPGEFFDPGRRLRVDVVFQERVGDVTEERIISRVITPNPITDLEPITNFTIDGEREQLAPITLSFQLSTATRNEANAASDANPFELTISPGGGEDAIVLIRDGDTPEDAFEVQGSDGTVRYDSATGVVTLQSSPDSDGILRYRQFGRHTIRVFSDNAFGNTEIEIADVLPIPGNNLVAAIDPLGNLQIRGLINLDLGGQVIANIGGRQLIQEVAPDENSIEINGNVAGIGANQVTILVEENEPRNPTSVEQTIPVDQLEITVTPSIFTAPDTNQALLQLDLDELLEAMAANGGIPSEGIPVNLPTQVLDVTVINEETNTEIAFQTTVTGLPGGDGFVSIEGITFSADGGIPLSLPDDATVQVKVQGVEGVSGTSTTSVGDVEDVVQRVSLFEQPDGSVTGEFFVPFGFEGEVTGTVGQDTFVVGLGEGNRFSGELVDAAGVAAGDAITFQLGDGSATSEVIQQKTAEDVFDIDIEVIDNPNPDDPDQSLAVEFDFSTLIDAMNDRLDIGESVSFDVSMAVGAGPFSGRISLRKIGVGMLSDSTIIGALELDNGETRLLLESFPTLSFAIAPPQGEDVLSFSIEDVSGCIDGTAFLFADQLGFAGIGANERVIIDDDGDSETPSGVVSVTSAAALPGGVDTDVLVSPNGIDIVIGGQAIGDGESVLINSGAFRSGDGQFIVNKRADNLKNRGQIVFRATPFGDDKPIELTTDVFFVDVTPAEQEPCEDHPNFPTGRIFGGDVTILFADGNLTLAGDAENNGVAVFADERGIVVQAIGGTTLNGSANEIVILEGTDVLDGDFTVSSLGDGDDLLCLENFRITREINITSTPGDDVILATGMDFDLLVRLDVGSGNDLIDVSGSTSDIGFNAQLGDGEDVYIGSESPDFVFGGAGIDTIDTRGGDDRITGGAGADIQRGGDGNDLFLWNDGDGPDDNFGEAGDFDALLFIGADDADDQIRLALAADVGGTGDGTHPDPTLDLTRTAPTEFTIEMSGIENVDLDGFGGNDLIDASAIPAGVFAEAPGSVFGPVTLRGGLGNDELRGTQGQDVLLGGEGDDLLIGNLGDDFALGGGLFGFDPAEVAGDDTFIWNNGDGADNVLGDTGIDTFIFNGAVDAADVVSLTPGSDDGDLEAENFFGPSVDLNRSLPSEFTIETAGFENFQINLLGGDDRLDGTRLPDVDLLRVAISGDEGDDRIEIADVDAQTFDGGTGFDEVTISTANVDLDFKTLADEAFKDVDALDLDDAGNNVITLSPDEVRRVVGANADITLKVSESDVLDLGFGWQREASALVDEVFQQVFVDEPTRLRVQGGSPFRNPTSPGDVNGDNRVSALDALLIINELRRARSFQVELPEQRDDLDQGLNNLLFLDVNGDGFVSALDALRVINELNFGPARQSEPPVASEPIPARSEVDEGKRLGVDGRPDSRNERPGLF